MAADLLFGGLPIRRPSYSGYTVVDAERVKSAYNGLLQLLPSLQLYRLQIVKQKSELYLVVPTVITPDNPDIQ